MKSQLRIFSYRPNPRVFKSTITARICDVSIEVRSAKPSELKNWLWDFDARAMNENDLECHKALEHKAQTGYQGELYKTKEFLQANPYGTVPAAFSPDGAIGLFESNSIMRAVARLDNADTRIYGGDPYGSSRIDGFLDTSLLFARDSQIYLLALMSETMTDKIYSETESALENWLAGIESALSYNNFICDENLTLADICFACELVLLQGEHQWEEYLLKAGKRLLFSEKLKAKFPRAVCHYNRLCENKDFSPDIAPHLAKINSGEALYD